MAEAVYRHDGVISRYNIRMATGPLQGKDGYRRYIAECCARTAARHVGKAALFLEIGAASGTLVRRILDNVKPPNPYWLVDTWDGRASTDDLTVKFADATDLDAVRRSFSDDSTVHFLQGVVPDILAQLPNAPVGFAYLCIGDRDAEVESYAVLAPCLAPQGILLWNGYGRDTTDLQRQRFMEIAANHGHDLMALVSGQAIVSA